MLNTHNLDMILQLKYMPIVMNPATIASSDWKYAMVCDTPYLKNEFGDPRFFLRFLSNFVIFHLQSFKNSVRGNFWARTSLRSTVDLNCSTLRS